MYPRINGLVRYREEYFGGTLYGPKKYGMYTLDCESYALLKLIDGTRSLGEILDLVKKNSGNTKKTQEFINQLTNLDVIKFIKEKSKKRKTRTSDFLKLWQKKPSKKNYYQSPLMVYIEVTNSCNLSCMHCYNRAGKRADNELTKKEMYKLIDELSTSNILFLAISGGEPLLRNDIFDILRYAKEKKLEIILSTNGTMINKEVVKKLKDIGVTTIQISLDSSSAEKHDLFRGVKGTFEKAIKAIKLLNKEKGMEVTICTSVSKFNAHEIEDIIKLVIKLKCKRYRILFLIPAGRALGNLKFLILTKNKMEEVAKRIALLGNKYKNEIYIYKEMPYDFISKGGSELCTATRSICKIDAEGNVYPCPFFCDFIAGNIRKNKFINIWHNSPIFKMFRELTVKGKCASCKYYPKCEGGCRAASYYYNGDIHSSDPFCWIARV